MEQVKRNLMEPQRRREWKVRRRTPCAPRAPGEGDWKYFRPKSGALGEARSTFERRETVDCPGNIEIRYGRVLK
jgi:hypothetical protein